MTVGPMRWLFHIGAVTTFYTAPAAQIGCFLDGRTEDAPGCEALIEAVTGWCGAGPGCGHPP